MSEVKRIKPSLSEGTRDFLPSEVAKRNYIFNTIKTVFRKYGFEEIETPAIEKLETLQGKYGDEGDKLLFKIRSNKNLYYNLSENLKENLKKEYPYEFIPKASDKGLRYDLTVPLARYAVLYQDKIAFPFKRFQIAQVWRGDKPQKGRYQEFYQCDADVIGSTSLLNEVELTMIYVEVFKKLGINVSVQINNRKVLLAIAKHFGIEDRFNDFIHVMDKLDKIGWQGVAQELIKSNIKLLKGKVPVDDKLYVMDLNEFKDGIGQGVLSWNDLKKNITEIFSRYGGYGWDTKTQEGINELYSVGKYFEDSNTLSFNPYLVRGLDYYTGTIWEVTLDKRNDVNKGISIGSLGGGGRYDNLTEMFGGQNMSGVGISFGIERIYDIMEELNLFPETISQGVKVLFVPRDASAEEFTFQQTQKLRDAGIPAEIFLGNVKKQKQFNYAEQKNIAYLVEVGGDEVSSGKFRLRNAKTRETENDLSIEQIIAKLQ